MLKPRVGYVIISFLRQSINDLWISQPDPCRSPWYPTRYHSDTIMAYATPVPDPDPWQTKRLAEPMPQKKIMNDNNDRTLLYAHRPPGKISSSNMLWSQPFSSKSLAASSLIQRFSFIVFVLVMVWLALWLTRCASSKPKKHAHIVAPIHEKKEDIGTHQLWMKVR